MADKDVLINVVTIRLSTQLGYGEHVSDKARTPTIL